MTRNTNPQQKEGRLGVVAPSLLRRIKKGLAIGTIGLSGLGATAHAELIEYSFTSAQGESLTVPAGQNYVNPKGEIKFALSAGVDRRVRVSILDQKNKVLSTATGKILGAEDRITAAGSRYYGEVLSLPAPGEGAYTIQAEIITADGKTSVQKDKYPLNVDITPPSSSGAQVTGALYEGVGTGSLWKLGTGATTGPLIVVSNIADNHDISSVNLVVTRQDNSIYKTLSMSYDGARKEASRYILNGVFPNSDLNEDFLLTFVISDPAGNKKVIGPQKARYDNISNHPAEPFGVYDPDHTGSLVPGLKGFVPYKSGMTVKTNPIRLAWRLPKSDWHEHREGGVSLVNALGELSKVHTDANYVYLVTGTPYGNTDHNYVRWSNFGAWGGGGLSYNLALSPSAPKTPRLLSVEYNYSDIGWGSFYRYEVDNSALPVTVKGIRVNAEARTYVQTAHHRGSCSIPVGATSCLISENYTLTKGTTGYLHDNATIYNPGNTLRSNPLWAEVNWNDLHYPALSHSYDEQQKILTAYINQPARGAYFDRLRLDSTWIEDDKKNRLPVKGVLTDNNVENYTYTFDLKNIPEGGYNLVLAAKERHGPVTRTPLFFYGSDTTPPSMDINVKSGAAIETLDDFEISLYDNIDTDPNLISVLLQGGPAKDQVKLSWRKVNNGQFKLEYPIMFPSMVEGEEYTLTATGSDAHSNTVSKSVSFTYSPRLMELAGGMDGKIYLPAVTSNFKRKNGLSVISTEPIKLGEGEHVMGTYDVIVSSRSDSEVPVIINGRIIQPGDAATVAAQHNFSTTGGRIDIPVTAAENGKVGKAYVLVTTSAPNSPVATVELSFWDAVVNLQSDTWTYRQVIDPLDIRALPEKGTMCRLSLSEPIAQKADPISDPVCLLEWTQMPDEAEIAAIKAESGSDRVVGLQGQAVRVGQQDIKYTLYMYSGDSKIRVGGGSGAIDVVSAVGAITYQPTENLSEVFRKIQSMTLKLKQDEGPKCRLTNNAEEAVRYGASSASTSKACYLEWMSYPSTLEVGNTTEPMLYGYLNDHKKEEITWRLSIYSKAGTRVNLGSQTYEIDVINPPAPTISIDSKFKVGDNYVLPMNQSLLGYAAFEGEPADLFVGINKDGEQVEAEVFYSGWVRERNKVNRVLEVDHDKGLYGSTVLGLKTYYNLLPDVGDETELSVISVPSSNVEPNFTIANNKVLDTEILPLTVTMVDRNSYDRIYHSDYGQWSVALFQQVRSLRDGDKLVELTEAKITDENGQVSFDVDMSKVEGSGARVIAMATLVHDIPDYERVVESRPVFTSVLYGGEVDGNVTARRYSGESVYSAYFQFVPNRENVRAARALGDTRWSVSADDGATWEEFEPGVRPIFARDFEKGIYQIKATSLNRFSGAEFTSAAIELVVYDKPYLELEGPRRLMVGDTANLKVIPYIHGEKRPLEDFVFKWSTDKGETYTSGSNEYSVTQDDPGTFQLRVRVKEVDAPEDDAKAWTEMRINPRFYPVRGPKIGLRAPNKVEVGKEYTVVATARSRVPEMQGQIIGEFVMPDGTRHRGTELTYIPTKEEELEGRVSVSYEAWFEGFEKDGFSSRSTNMRVWEYVWPNFKIRPFGTIRFAPTKIQMSIVQENSATVLEKPEYTWTLPEGAEIIRQVGGRIEFMLNKGGDYEIAANISDARGHSSDVALALNLEDAPAWEIESEVTYSNETMREPVVISYRPQFSGGHPRDRIVSKKFYVNGELFKEGGFTAKQELRAGKHTIAVEMESRYGQFARDEVEVDVIKNIPPVCSIEVVDLGSKWRVIPQCEDEDGIVRRLEWLVNDVASSGSKYKTFIKSRLSEPYVVQVSALDDSGDSSDPRWVTLNPEPKPDASESTGNDTGAGSDDENQGAEVDE